MCLSLPAQILAIQADTAIVAAGSTRLEVGRRLLPEARPGDWVLIHTGQIISQISAEEAVIIQELIQEIVALGQTGEDP
ncbi:MAG: HypC/HybG/HupF family hydrogenase formation chaperone [Chloroflexota bacterium]